MRMPDRQNIFNSSPKKTSAQVYEDAMASSIKKKNEQGEALLPDEQKFIAEEEMKKEVAEQERKDLELEHERLLKAERKRSILELSMQFKKVQDNLVTYRNKGYMFFELKQIEFQQKFHIKAAAARAQISDEDIKKAESMANGELAEDDVFPELK